MAIRKGDQVWDKVTKRVATVASASCRKEDGRWHWYYKLADVPTCPDYPTGWRFSGEVSQRRDLIAEGQE